VIAIPLSTKDSDGISTFAAAPQEWVMRFPTLSKMVLSPWKKLNVTYCTPLMVLECTLKFRLHRNGIFSLLSRQYAKTEERKRLFIGTFFKPDITIWYINQKVMSLSNPPTALPVGVSGSYAAKAA